MSYVNSSCTVIVTGVITSNTPRDFSNDRTKISITIKNKKSKDDRDMAFVNCYFSTKYLEKVRPYLKVGQALNITGELSFTSFKEDRGNNIDINGYSLHLIDSNKDYDDNYKNHYNNRTAYFNKLDDDIPF